MTKAIRDSAPYTEFALSKMMDIIGFEDRLREAENMEYSNFLQKGI